MDSERKDPDALKFNILQLLIKYPNGVKFEDFSGAFYQIHNFHPKFSHYGYSSLRQLLCNMKETVVVESTKSCGSVMKLISGLNLDGLLDQIEKSRPDSFEEEDSTLKEEERRESGEDTAADLAEVLAAITNLLKEYESGLKLEKIQTLLLSTVGIDLQTFISTKGYKDILTFMDDQIPQLIIRHRESLHRCVVQLSKVPFRWSSYQSSYSSSDTNQSTCTSNNSNKDKSEKMPALNEVMALVIALLSKYERGLRICKLQEFLLVKHGIDLENFSIAHGYRDTMEFIEQKMPQLLLSCQRDRLNTVATEPHSALKNVVISLTALLRRYMSGLTVKELQVLFLAEEGFDLEKFCFALGYKDTVEFLEEKMPQLTLNYRTNRLNSIIIKPHSGKL
ncbi:hypothetical protein E2320_002970 [Naja naja]|nr:hypothetical protein E2320_002970 [Naja naja]